MAPNEEIKQIMLDCKSKGLNSMEVLQLMEIPCELTDYSYLFDFGSMPIEELSKYIDYILRMRWYLLDTGTITEGLYKRTKTVHDPNAVGRNKRVDVKCLVEVDIYPNEGKTYLEVSMPSKEDSKIEKLFTLGHGDVISDTKISELNEIIDQIKFLKPSIMGYLVCNKCGAYYEVSNEESLADFPDKCECGGTFEYIKGPKQPEEKTVVRTEKSNPTEYLRAPSAMILISLACFGSLIYHFVVINFIIAIVGLPYGLSLILLRYRKQELVLNMLSRRGIYFLAAIIFLLASYGLITVLFQINDIITMIEFSLFTILAIIYCFGMLFKTVNMDDSRNFLDPPL
ncbi:MAG: hypothetical protein WCF28_06125 [Methanobacterium sp.]|uniref:hypothetical protein n=1 Tax=Methanobacterium sp. TaxID=2164 RepID=UPI003C790345